MNNAKCKMNNEEFKIQTKLAMKNMKFKIQESGGEDGSR